MIKKSTNENEILEYLHSSLDETDFSFNLVLENLLDKLVKNRYCSSAMIQDQYSSKQFTSNNYKKEAEFTEFAIGNWGILYLENYSKKKEAEIKTLVSNLSFFIQAADLKEKADLSNKLSSEIRKSLKPELALEKIYKSFKEICAIKDMYFFKKFIHLSDDEDEEISRGYHLYFHNNQKIDLELSSQVIDADRIKSFDLIEELEFAEIFVTRVRAREWGLMLVNKTSPWTNNDREYFSFFSEQMATVFNQHELHSESLTMAQREFLLNQITTKIRESLVVDKIIETAVQEIAQVMGVESCGILILNKRIRASVGHKVWSTKPEQDSQMIEALYACLQTDLVPSWMQTTKSISDLELENDRDSNRINKLGIKSIIVSGMFNEKQDELVGIVVLSFFDQIRFWSNDEKQLLEGACKQLEIALLQAAVYQEAQQTRREMALLHKLSCDIRDSLDTSIVLGQIARGIGEVLGLNRCFVRIFSKHNSILKTEQEYCSPGFEPTADMIFGFERDWISQLSSNASNASSNEVLNITSIENKFQEEYPELIKIAEAIKLKSYLAIPLLARGKVLGTINVHQCDRERNFQQEEIEFIMRVGAEAAIAIEHASLFETINRFNKTDPDTGLYNKRYFRTLAIQEIEKCKVAKQNISFMLIDADHLKSINDNPEFGGHDAGDEAIQILAQVLSKTVRQTPIDEIHRRVADVVGRFGGDEFMILLPNTHIDDAIRVAHRIASNLAKAKHSSWPYPITCSIGIAGTPNDPYDYEQFKTLADKALYLSKDKGRNSISSTLDL